MIHWFINMDNLKYVTSSATLIGFITLLGAAIALMNIMLVSVTERTNEIGTRKAIGATSKTVRQQFLMEAIVICQLGGIVGIMLGILIGNIISILIDSAFVIPWVWLGAGILIMFICWSYIRNLSCYKSFKTRPYRGTKTRINLSIHLFFSYFPIHIHFI